MPNDADSSHAKRKGRVQISALHEQEQFGELQGELRENADDVGFQQQLLLENAPGHDQQHPQADDQEEERRRYGRLQRNRPRPFNRD